MSNLNIEYEAMFQDEKAKGNVTNLIPVFKNTCRCDNYYWHWRKEIGDWIRGEAIPEKNKRMYNTPQVKSNYK